MASKDRKTSYTDTLWALIDKYIFRRKNEYENNNRAILMTIGGQSLLP